MIIENIMYIAPGETRLVIDCDGHGLFSGKILYKEDGTVIVRSNRHQFIDEVLEELVDRASEAMEGK